MPCGAHVFARPGGVTRLVLGLLALPSLQARAPGWGVWPLQPLHHA